jgi:hypothetical protein
MLSILVAADEELVVTVLDSVLILPCSVLSPEVTAELMIFLAAAAEDELVVTVLDRVETVAALLFTVVVRDVMLPANDWE